MNESFTKVDKYPGKGRERRLESQKKRKHDARGKSMAAYLRRP